MSLGFFCKWSTFRQLFQPIGLILLYLTKPCSSALTLKIGDVPVPTWLLILWPLPLMGLNELVKHYEIK